MTAGALTETMLDKETHSLLAPLVLLSTAQTPITRQCCTNKYAQTLTSSVRHSGALIWTRPLIHLPMLCSWTLPSRKPPTIVQVNRPGKC